MNLLSVQGRGAVYTVCLLLICIIIVHAFRLAKLGYRTLGKKLPPEKPKPKPPQPEPVYYLVEKKKKRPKQEYSSPKRIQFR